MTREMLKYKILANNAPAVTMSYTFKKLKIYETGINEVFKKISTYINKNKKIPLSKKDIRLSNFGRLTG